MMQPEHGAIDEYTYRDLRIVDYTLDDAQLATRCPLDNGRHQHQPRHSAGRVDLLSLELIAEILLELDLPTVTAFRSVNRRAMQLVDSIHEYRKLWEHCPNILRAIISIDARHFTCRTLYKTLSATRCDTCDRFGAYLYLITCRRVCYFCFTRNTDYFPISIGIATKLTTLSKREVRKLPHVVSLPGLYTAGEKASRSRTILFDRQAIFAKASQTHTLTQRDMTTREPRRYMSIISAPYLEASGQLAKWGLFCVGCTESKGNEKNFRNMFTEDGIVEHINRNGFVLTHSNRHQKPS
ncbi:Hypothetical protein R9X50_00072900 [Acrodontium crateriforme]|uniref:F-box domain-containing protein n=1 Tax=Acrodontium crateriforme TaxID=150365 RepID=A0AAQ3M3R4_9PEZI|nr:Hypothetical protein R9X50_00072900 [Acrodontium crateriforme]